MTKEIITYYPYQLVKPITINDRLINQIDISSHCDKHLKHGITHQLIIELVERLDKGDFEVDSQDGKMLYFKRYWDYMFLASLQNDKKYSLELFINNYLDFEVNLLQWR